MTPDQDRTDTLDVSDLDRYMGVPMRPGELKEPVALNDIRRWVQAMHYPNPLHYDERWAAESRFGEILAPLSFTVACDTSHGASPAQVGRIPGSHLIFGGDDWWFFGPRILAGRQAGVPPHAVRLQGHGHQVRRPDVLPAGRHPLHQPAGERIAQQRSTAIRYRVQRSQGEEGLRRAQEPDWTDAQLAELEERKLGFIDQIQSLGHDKRLFASVSVGDVLAEQRARAPQPRRFTTEWRAYPMTTWGATAKGPTTVRARSSGTRRRWRDSRATAAWSGSIPSSPTAPTTDRRVATCSPGGPATSACPGAMATAHRWGRGSSTTWPPGPASGGTIAHSSAQYRNPAFTGDATFLHGQVVDTRVERKRVHSPW